MHAVCVIHQFARNIIIDSFVCVLFSIPQPTFDFSPILVTV